MIKRLCGYMLMQTVYECIVVNGLKIFGFNTLEKAKYAQ